LINPRTFIAANLFELKKNPDLPAYLHTREAKKKARLMLTMHRKNTTFHRGQRIYASPGDEESG
jgi:hypothetical protein